MDRSIITTFLTLKLACSLSVGVGAGAGELAGSLGIPADPVGSSAASGGAGAPRTAAGLTLAQVRQMAYQRNWDLLATRSGVDYAVAQKILARQFPNPIASFSLAKISADSSHGTSTLDGNDVFHRSYDTILAVGQLIEIGGKRAARLNSAQAGLESNEARLADARRLLELGVTRAYVAVLGADEAVRILSETAVSLRREATIAETRLRAGDIASSDKAQIEITAQRLELDARRAETEAVAARIRLETLLGEPEPKGTFSPGETLGMLLTNSLAMGGELSGMVQARPDVRGAEAEVRRAEAEVRLQRALRVPDPTVQLQYEHEPPEQPHTVGLGVSFPLPLWSRNRGGIAAAEATRQQAELGANRTAAVAVAEVAAARRDYEAALQRRDEYARNIVPKSSSIRETMTFAYQKGGASLLDLLSAERNDNEVRLSAAQAAADLVVARAALAAAVNEMPGPTSAKYTKP